MDKRERYESLQDALLAMLTGWQREMWTAMPGIITKYDAATQTCELKVPVQIMFKIGDAGASPQDIPPLLDVPVYFPAGGGYTLTFPVVVGDECLVVFASRCIDQWWKKGVTGVPPFFRMHDLSDGFAFVGFRAQTRMLAPAPSITGVELRADDGNTKVSIAGTTITVKAANVIVQASGSIKLQNAGAALKKLVNETFLALFDSHVHTSAASGSPTSAPITPSSGANATSITQAE